MRDQAGKIIGVLPLRRSYVAEATSIAVGRFAAVQKAVPITPELIEVHRLMTTESILSAHDQAGIDE